MALTERTLAKQYIRLFLYPETGFSLEDQQETEHHILLVRHDISGVFRIST